MKIRSIRMREAHRQVDGEAVSFCSIIWDNGAQHIVTSSSSDPTILIHDSLLLSSTPKKIRQHSDGVTALALSPNSTCLASASKDRSVKLYRFPGGDFDTNVTRFTLPIRAITFNGSGSTLAAAGDDEGIKLINAIDGSIARVLKGHNGSVTGLSFDPNGEYMSSIDSIGTVIFWELSSGKSLHVLTSVAPELRSDSSVINTLSWSPDGETLAVPGLRNDVVMYDRDTAEKLFTLGGDHIEPVCSISWSPNGRYIATSGSDKQVLVWDVEKREDIDRQKFSNVICSMSWKPIGNALSIIDVKGNYSVWEAPVPLSMKSPTEDLPSKSKNKNGYLLFTEEEKEEEEEEEEEASIPGGHILKKRRYLDDEMSEENTVHTPNSQVKRPRKPSPISPLFMASKPTMQEAFQPGSTPKQSGKRHFLCYNMVGSITLMEQSGYSHVEVDFHDTGIGPRIPSMTDYSGFTMASMNQSGSVFGSPSKGEKTMSTLMYRPFTSWANNSEWSMRFDDELRAVALGSGWVAAITSSNHLHIFTEGGLQKHVISLNGTIVTSSGLNEKIAVVVSRTDTQSLEFQVFDIFRRTLSFQGGLPLSPGSVLTWLGFSEEGQLASHDSKGVLRVYTDQFGGCWVPMFSTKRFSKSEDMYWAVGLDESKFFCIISTGTAFPQVVPKPVLTPVDLSLPLPVSDLGVEALENEFMMREMRLWRIREEIDRASVAGVDTVTMEDESFDMEAALDRCILRLIASCCNGDKLVRATELVRCLSLEKSVRGAVKLATALKLPSLAERFSGILEERIFEVAHTGGGECVKVVESDIKKEEKGSEPECVPSAPVVATLGTLPSPSSVKKKNKDRKGGDGSDGGLTSPASPTKKSETSLKQRPSNPFAKDSSSIDKGRPSFFESIKKMKGVVDIAHK